jgi:acyl-CoA hydrolase
MQEQQTYVRHLNEFIVHPEHINDKGVLGLCKILKEITHLYDRAIIHAFGDLSYYKVEASSHHLDLKDMARVGDVIRLDAESIVHLGLSVDVNIIVNNASSNDRTLAIGHFVFSRQLAGMRQAVSLS